MGMIPGQTRECLVLKIPGQTQDHVMKGVELRNEFGELLTRVFLGF